ncbi:hypothetical protein JOB18_009582 [Solea senegalensis]|uniref:Uncharacterized protein n=1 Tax=Solea senegalensis TaxID=28829 RepID=A0AAV6S9R3_SOLSE|nr:hypothetical protein JOB18_009582 [Solea senegalensis]
MSECERKQTTRLDDGWKQLSPRLLSGGFTRKPFTDTRSLFSRLTRRILAGLEEVEETDSLFSPSTVSGDLSAPQHLLRNARILQENLENGRQCPSAKSHQQPQQLDVIGRDICQSSRDLYKFSSSKEVPAFRTWCEDHPTNYQTTNLHPTYYQTTNLQPTTKHPTNYQTTILHQPTTKHQPNQTTN